MNTINDLLFVIFGTAAITAFVVAVFINRSSPRREPPVIYVNVPSETASSGTGCLPLAVLMAVIMGVFWFGL